MPPLLIVWLVPALPVRLKHKCLARILIVIEEWSPTPPNEDEPLAAAAEINQVIRHATSPSAHLLDNNNQDPSKTKSPAHPIGLVHNYISKWKNKIKK
jgi:hypothetical protein